MTSELPGPTIVGTDFLHSVDRILHLGDDWLQVVMSGGFLVQQTVMRFMNISE